MIPIFIVIFTIILNKRDKILYKQMRDIYLKAIFSFFKNNFFKSNT